MVVVIVGEAVVAACRLRVGVCFLHAKRKFFWCILAVEYQTGLFISDEGGVHAKLSDAGTDIRA